MKNVMTAPAVEASPAVASARRPPGRPYKKIVTPMAAQKAGKAFLKAVDVRPPTERSEAAQRADEESPATIQARLEEIES